MGCYSHQELMPNSMAPGWCSQFGLESLKPALYHRLILYNITKEAVGYINSPFQFAAPYATYGGYKMCKGRSFSAFITMIKYPSICDRWPKTKANHVIMDPQGEYETEPWMAYTIARRKLPEVRFKSCLDLIINSNVLFS